MKFKPRAPGLLRVLVQQPEAEELLAGEAEATFDLEVGVYDPVDQKFVAAAMNRHLELSGGRPAKLEYAAVTFEVTKDLVEKGHPVYVFFRALNFSDDGTGHKAAEGCLTLFIEAEFRPDAGDCRHSPALKSTADTRDI